MNDLCDGTSNHIGFFIFICAAFFPAVLFVFRPPSTAAPQSHTSVYISARTHLYLHINSQRLSSSSFIARAAAATAFPGILFENVNKRKYKPIFSRLVVGSFFSSCSFVRLYIRRKWRSICVVIAINGIFYDFSEREHICMHCIRRELNRINDDSSSK